MKYFLAASMLAVSLPMAAYAQQQGMQSQQNMPDPGQMFLKQFDANKDGKVTMDEFLQPQVERMKQGFMQMDANNDGVVTAEEASAYMNKQMEQMRQMRGGQQQGRQ